MAREPERKGGIFGGRNRLREDLRDTSGDEKINFADTWLGDFLGFDGKVGSQGPGLRESWFGARRDGPGSKANRPNLEDVLVERRQTGNPDRTTEAMAASGPPTRARLTGAPVHPVTTTPLVPGTGKTLDEILAQEVESTSPSAMTDGPTIGTPAVPAGDVGVSRPSLVERPSYGGYIGFGVSEPDTAPTIETATSYPMAEKVAQLLGPKNPYVLQKLPEVLNTQLQVDGYNNINDLVRRIQALPETKTQQEVLNELYIMRDKLRGW